MSAIIIMLPVIRSCFASLSALEQRDREYAASLEMKSAAPPRTRPLLVVTNPPRRAKSKVGSRKRRPRNGG